MVLRNGLFGIALGSIVMLAGCTAPSDESDVEQSVGATESELEVNCDELDVCPDDDLAPRATIGTLTGFNTDGRLTWVVGANTYSAFVNATTRSRVTQLNFWPPQPIREVAARWNDLVLQPGPAYFTTVEANGDTFSSLTTEFAAAGVQMKIKLNKDGSLKALRPVQ